MCAGHAIRVHALIGVPSCCGCPEYIIGMLLIHDDMQPNKQTNTQQQQGACQEPEVSECKDGPKLSLTSSACTGEAVNGNSKMCNCKDIMQPNWIRSGLPSCMQPCRAMHLCISLYIGLDRRARHRRYQHELSPAPMCTQYCASCSNLGCASFFVFYLSDPFFLLLFFSFLFTLFCTHVRLRACMHTFCIDWCCHRCFVVVSGVAADLLGRRTKKN